MKKIILSILILIIISSTVNADFWNQITGKATEEAQTATEPVPIPELVSEKVECVFDGSDSNQACYSGPYKCSGMTGCAIEVKESKGTALVWKSSCGGEATTTVDGAPEAAKFKCAPATPTLESPAPVAPQELVKERVECIFDGTDSAQTCYSGEYKCEGVKTCTVEVQGVKDKKVEWKSTCGGYASTVMDGTDEPAKFNCVPATTAQTLPSVTTPVEEVKEIVHCDFAYSKSEQKCYTADGRFSCTGITSCEATQIGKKGQVYTWQGTCPSGYADTTIDGINQNVWFNCEPLTEKEAVSTIKKPLSTEPPADTSTAQPTNSAASGGVSVPPYLSDYVKEHVECIFWNSDVLRNPHTAAHERCYSADGRFGCEWSGEVTQKENTDRYAYCVAVVEGKRGEPQMWKSTCGGYAHTILDAKNEEAQFKCVPSAEIKPEQIQGKGFRKAYWQCYDGREEKVFAEVDVGCKYSETWQMNAKNSCRDHCNADNSKCGVNSFSVMEECYMAEEVKRPIYEIPEKETQMQIPEREIEEKRESKRIEPPEKEIIKEISLPQLRPTPIMVEEPQPFMCKDSCPSDGKCYPFGYRKGGQYCSDDGAFRGQSQENAQCDNNFECSTNLCVDSRCMSSGIIRKILDWFRRWFPFTEKKTEPEVQDCGKSSDCMEAAFKVCRPAKMTDQNGPISEIRITGLEGEKCVMKFIAGAESLNCRFKEYAQGTKNLGSSLEQFCEGSLLYRLSTMKSATLKAATPQQTLEQTSTVAARKLSNDANDIRYQFTVRDRDGIRELNLVKSNYGEVRVEADPQCVTEFVTEQKFEASDLPLSARVLDCKGRMSEMKLEIDKEIVVEVPTETDTLNAMSACEKIKSPGLKQKCAAMIKKDPSDCGMLDESAAPYCYADVALATGNSAICGKITDSGHKESCEALVERAEDKCSNWIYADYCYRDVAALIGDASICDYIKYEGGKIECKAVILRDASLCKNSDNQDCYQTVALLTGDEKACDELKKRENEQAGSIRMIYKLDEEVSKCIKMARKEVTGCLFELNGIGCDLIPAMAKDPSLCENLGALYPGDISSKDRCYFSAAMRKEELLPPQLIVLRN